MAKVTEEYPGSGKELTNEQLKAQAIAEAQATQPAKAKSKVSSKFSAFSLANILNS